MNHDVEDLNSRFLKPKNRIQNFEHPVTMSLDIKKFDFVVSGGVNGAGWVGGGGGIYFGTFLFPVGDFQIKDFNIVEHDPRM